MTRFKVNIKGLDEYEKRLGIAPEKIEKAAEKAINVTALNIEREAKLAAPVNDGALRAGIRIEDDSEAGVINRTVGVRVNYAPYVEFGTKTRVDIPNDSDVQRYAAQFKSKGGSFQDLLRNIREWARKKGIEPDAAFPIALKIAKYGVHAKPFLFPAYFKERGKLSDRINKNLNL